MKRLLSHIWRTLTTYKVVLILSVIFVLSIVSTVVAFAMFFNQQHTGQPTTQKVAKKVIVAPVPPVKYYSPLTGLEVADKATSLKEVKAVMIENSPDARPQSGLHDAGVVFEAVAEAGITRFAILFQEASPTLIGPVRSVRPYYLDWLAAFDASVSHVGGSAKALATVRNGTFKDLDQFFNGNSYWRATDRYAPHNVYTSSAKLDALNQSKGYTTSNFTGFPRKLEAPSLKPTASKIDIQISAYDLYNVHYDYDKPTNSYIRWEGGQKHLDRESGQIMPKVVIAMKVPTATVLEDGYREEMQTIGSGEADVFQDGTIVKGTWTKADQKSQIVFKDSAGKPLLLNPGQTWISVTAPENRVTWQ